MPHDPERIAEVRSWFLKAGTDLRDAAFELTAEPPLTADVVFHAQQATAVDPELEPVLRRAAPLTEYAWRFRYPGDPTEPTAEEAREALGIARETFDALLARLPAEVRP